MASGGILQVLFVNVGGGGNVLSPRVHNSAWTLFSVHAFELGVTILGAQTGLFQCSIPRQVFSIWAGTSHISDMQNECGLGYL